MFQDGMGSAKACCIAVITELFPARLQGLLLRPHVPVEKLHLTACQGVARLWDDI